MISKFFINRPIFATVIAILLVVAGLFTLRSLPIAQYPEITPPTIQVSASYPGASAETVAQTIGVPVEQQVNGVEGMMYMSSNSSNGQYNLTITFEVGTNIDMASVLVQNRVNLAEPNLPTAVIQQGLTVQKQSTNIVMFLALKSDNPIYDELYLSNYANINIVNELARLPGVGGVSVFGGSNYSMRIWLDPESMRIRGLTPANVVEMIESQNIEVSAGNVGAPPATTGNAFQYTITTQGRLMTTEEFGNIILRTNKDGSFLRLKDVSNIELGSESYSNTSSEKGEQIAAIGIYQLPGSNSLDVAQEILKKVEDMQKYLPEGISFSTLLNTTEFITASIDEVLLTFLETTLLVILVIFIFLQNFRAVLIPALSIPVSLIATFAVMRIAGFSINLLTLFGLVLAIAIVVDDAIVVVENASRLLDTGKYTRKEAVSKAMEEIQGPVIGVVLVLLAVFVPTAFIGGITGQLYKQFALTIAAATFFSGLNSLIFTPALCALFLKPIKQAKSGFFKWFNRFYDKTLNRYVKIVTVFLKKPVLVMSIYAVVAFLTVLLFMKWPSSFLPSEDLGYFMVGVQLPNSASLSRTEEVTAQIGAILDSYPEVRTYMTINGFSMMGGGQSSNGATLFVMLKDWKDRKGKDHSAFAVIDRLNKDADSIQQAMVFAVDPPSIPGLGEMGGLAFELEDINNYGSTDLANAVNTIMENYHGQNDIMMLNTMYQGNSMQYYLNINRDKLALMGIQLSDVYNTLSDFMGIGYVNDFIEFGNIYQVIVQGDKTDRNNILDVFRLSVSNSNNEMVPFSAFTTIEEKMGQDQITRYNMYTAAGITVIPAINASSQEGIQAMESLVEKLLGDSFGYEWTSIAYQENAAGSTTMLIFILAILIAILVLSAQYESFTNPWAVLLGVPLALLGAIVGCIIMKMPISIYTEIGIVLLIALSAKNGILIVEFAIDYRKSGQSIIDSAMEAGRVRLRPILMTSFAFILGVMPLLFATGAGSNARLALGAAVIFGMLFNTLFATLFIPSFFHITQSLQEKFSKRGDDNPQRIDAYENNLNI